MAIGLWLASDLSILTVLAEVAAVVFLLASAYWLGRRDAPSQRGAYASLLPEESEATDLSFDRSTKVTPEPAPYEEVEEKLLSQGTLLQPEFLNKACVLGWPLAKEFAMNTLLDQVLPQLQKIMPAGFSINLWPEQTDIGDTTPKFIRFECIPMQVESARLGSLKVMRCMCDFTYNGECKIGLAMEMQSHIIDKIKSMATHVLGSAVHGLQKGAAMTLHAGVSDVYFKGRCVVEVFDLRAGPPFFSGLRVYFANSPHINLQVRGEMHGLTNMSWVKHKILEQVDKQFAQTFVLPNRLCIRTNRQMCIWALKAPRPLGFLRIAVLDVRGMDHASSCYVTLQIGAKAKKTPSKNGGVSVIFDEGTAFDFSVSDPFAQALRISVCEEEKHHIFGSSQGTVAGHGQMLLSNMLHGASSKQWTFWLNFPAAGGDMVRAPSISASGWPLIDSVESEPDSGLCVKLQLEFRHCINDSAQAEALKSGRSSFNLWELKNQLRLKDASHELSCNVVVCIHHMNNVPFAEDPNRKYWCVLTKRGQDSKQEPEVEQHGKKKRAVFTKPSDSAYKSESHVDWQHAAYFSVMLPHLATILVEVKTEVSGKFGGRGSETIGTFTWEVAPLLSTSNRVQQFDADVGTSGCALKQCCMKLWMVGPKEQGYAESSKTHQSGWGHPEE